MNNHDQNTNKTSWENVNKWYKKTVDLKGNYYHQNVVIPRSLGMMKLGDKSSVVSILDLACGQGVLSRHLNNGIHYLGIDASRSLIDFAIKNNINNKATFLVGDITSSLKIPQTHFSHACIILALQNVPNIKSVFDNAYKYLEPNGKFLIVLNHPSFRIPRHSSWEVDDKNNIQYRRIDRYMSNMEVAISTEPSKGEKSSQTYSYHYPLSYISKALSDSGFLISEIEEWVSDKTSVGTAAKRENKAREEFPLFMAILAQKS